ncbi:hypothetical protein [Streptomyces alkaliterrae]|uniref:Secreted protein n=1 Tax=Streptomyces alkaliterrae TaxID=2213162 RepID=A0A5P0YV02_9ACTN|nr:hypothetical protein [Streptomyces alkaliterrae]MBB1261384.1 hypothetical protein [Streptomyces alkaliterrae]MQS03437.1 hypothetical protein [Streptomyces alkaliterrae]
MNLKEESLSRRRLRAKSFTRSRLLAATVAIAAALTMSTTAAAAHSPHPGPVKAHGCQVTMKTPRLHSVNQVNAMARVDYCSSKTPVVTIYLAYRTYQNGKWSGWNRYLLGSGWNLHPEKNYDIHGFNHPDKFQCVRGVTRVMHATVVKIGIDNVHSGTAHRSDRTITSFC